MGLDTGPIMKDSSPYKHQCLHESQVQAWLIGGRMDNLGEKMVNGKNIKSLKLSSNMTYFEDRVTAEAVAFR